MGVGTYSSANFKFSELREARRSAELELSDVAC